MKPIIPILTLIFLCGCNQKPSGDLTFIEGKLVSNINQSPLANQQVYIITGSTSFLSGGVDQSTPPSDSVKTDELGNFEYAFFHNQCCRYYFNLAKDYCFELQGIKVATRYRPILRAAPFFPLLNINVKSGTDSLSNISLSLSSDNFCVGNDNFNAWGIPVGYDTTIVLNVPQFVDLTVTYQKINLDRTVTREQKGVTIQDQPVQLFFD